MKKDLKIKLLCIDDEKDNLDTIKDFLSELHCDIETETNPKLALEKIASNYYDIVITDLMMPKVSGMEIAESVKSMGRDTLVIVVTGFASVDTAIKSIQFGVYDYIQKPFTNIKNVVQRAIEYLQLQRKNYELGKRIEDTLSKISLLHDISSILYQVSDFDESSEMILDTISEGFKVNQIGLMLKQNSKYEIVKYRNLNNDFCKEFSFENNESVNNIQISTETSTFVNDLNGKLKLSDTVIPLNKSIKSMVLIPINFHINTMGYLIVFTNTERNSQKNENLFELLEIFSTQIAPVVYSALNIENNKSGSEKYISIIIENKLIDAKKILSPISFALVRLTMIKTPQELNLVDDYLSSAKSIISKDLNGSGEAYWQNKDTGLIVYPAADLFMAEQKCIELMEKIEKLQLSGNKEKVLSMKYSCINYPQSGNSPITLARMLWKHLFEELEKNEEKIDEFKH